MIRQPRNRPGNPVSPARMADNHAMIDWLKQALIYGILIAAVWVAIVYLPRFRTVAVSGEYSEITGIDMVKSYKLDATVPLKGLSHGEGICYQLADEGDMAVRLGWVAGLPGDVLVTDEKGILTVNGKPIPRGGEFLGPPIGPLVVPAGHFMVVTDHHETDSFKHGPLPVIAYRGRIGDLP